MQPSEFYNCTYKELYDYFKANSEKSESDLKHEIQLFDSLGDKILGAIASKNPKNISLVRNTFKELFEEELKPHQQTPEEQIRILRSMK